MPKYPRISPFGDQALLVEFSAEIRPQVLNRVRKAAQDVAKSRIRGIREVIPSYCSLFIGYDPFILSFAQASSHLEKIACEEIKEPSPASAARKIPVVYGGVFGPDLNYVAAFHKISPESVVERHSSVSYLVYAIGGFPGLPAMGIVPKEIETPRLSVPREKVPAGSVAIAGKQTGIYAIESPGGWQWIGRTPLKIFDPLHDPPSLFRAGDRVRFYPISEVEFSKMEALDGFAQL